MFKNLYLTITFLFIVASLSGQVASQQSTQQEKRIALVIGNGNYIGSTLANPENDARAMKVALQSVGFAVMEYENLNQVQMKKAIDDFGTKLKTNEVGLFFYAGHGIQSKGYNYLIPVDAQLQSEQQVEYDCVQADRVLALMEASGTKVNIIILDACRNNPFERSWTRAANGRGLASMNAPMGTLIAYATAPGSTASDGSGKNGLYTSAILETMKIPNITILEMFQNVRNLVSQKSSKQQIPWESTSMTGNFYFNSGEYAVSESQNGIPVTPINEPPTLDERDYIIDSRDNKRYKTVKIGTQLWMAENLNTAKFNDGTPIPLVTDDNTWVKLTSPAYCFYDNQTQNGDTYGALYNYYAVNTGKLCPKGWHVPSDAEWAFLTSYLGSESVSGGKLKETGFTHWNSPNTGATNEAFFTALPGGCRQATGTFGFFGTKGLWWSATENGGFLAWYRSLSYNYIYAYREYASMFEGFSVRCVKD